MKFYLFSFSQRVEDMARLGGLMAALASGGEAQPNYPTFNKVMMVTGELKEPKRILPVFGFDGREL